MGFSALGDLNWLAVAIAAVAYFAVGAFWYMPMFPTGRIWQNAIGFTMHPEGQTPNRAIYAFPLLANVLVALVTGMLAKALGVASVLDGLVLGFWLWLGFGLSYWTLASIFNPHAKQPVTLLAISSLYHLVGLLIAGAVFGAFA